MWKTLFSLNIKLHSLHTIDCVCVTLLILSDDLVIKPDLGRLGKTGRYLCCLAVDDGNSHRFTRSRWGLAEVCFEGLLCCWGTWPELTEPDILLLPLLPLSRALCTGWLIFRSRAPTVVLRGRDWGGLESVVLRGREFVECDESLFSMCTCVGDCWEWGSESGGGRRLFGAWDTSAVLRSGESSSNLNRSTLCFAAPPYTHGDKRILICLPVQWIILILQFSTL